MAKRKDAGAVVERVQPYLEGVAKSLVDRLYGAAGPPWGTPLSELEDVVVALRQALSESLLAQALQRQAQTAERRPEPFQKCPGCTGPVAAKPDPEPRNVQTRGGAAVWEEPHLYGRQCRQSFFPSEPEFGP